jgi:hypothetical protein
VSIFSGAGRRCVLPLLEQLWEGLKLGARVRCHRVGLWKSRATDRAVEVTGNLAGRPILVVASAAIDGGVPALAKSAWTGRR